MNEHEKVARKALIAGGADPHQVGEKEKVTEDSSFLAAAKALVAGGKAKSLGGAIDYLQRHQPELYDEWLSMRPRILIATPTRGNDLTIYYVCSLVNSFYSLYHKFDFGYVAHAATLIHVTRNALADMSWGDYILFIDSDMRWVPCDIVAAVELNKDIVSGLYFQSGWKFDPEVFVWNGNHFGVKSIIPDEPFKCDGVGFGFILIKRHVLQEMFKKVKEEPTFGYPFDPLFAKGPKMGKSLYEDEDLSFCLRARELGFEIWCHPKILLGHEVNSFAVHKLNIEGLKYFIQRHGMQGALTKAAHK